MFVEKLTKEEKADYAKGGLTSVCQKSEFSELYHPIATEGFLMAHWPVSEANRNNLNQIQQTHVPVPIPVYRYNELLPPKMYRELSGALVLCKFSLSYWEIRENNKKCFNAIIRFVFLSILTPISG